MVKYLTFLLFLTQTLVLSSQVTIELRINNNTFRQAYLCAIRGSEIEIVSCTNFTGDSLSFILSAAPKGQYKILLRNHSQIDLIIDKDEQISIVTSLPNLKQNLKITKGRDNINYYSFINFRLKETARLTKIIADIGESNQTAERIGFLKGISSYKIHQYADSIIAIDSQSLLSKIIVTQIIPDLNLSCSTKPELTKYKNDREFLMLHFFDNIDFNDERLIKTDLLFKAIRTYIDQIVLPRNAGGFNYANEFILGKTNNPKVKKYLISELLNIYETTQLEEVYTKLFDDYVVMEPTILTDKQRLSVMHKINIIKNDSIGQKAQDFSFIDTLGTEIQLSSIKTDFNIIVFYQSDTKNIASTIKQLNYIYTQYHEKGIQIFAISMDNNTKRWKSFLRKNKFEYNNYIVKKESKEIVTDHYNTWSLPSIYILDQHNVIMKKPMNVDYIRRECKNVFH